MKKYILLLSAVMVLTISCDNSTATSEPEIKGYSNKEAIQNIFDRKSVRTYTDQAVEKEKVDLLVRAAMAAPSGMDRRPWEILVIDDREMLDNLAQAIPQNKMLTTAPLVIVVCGDPDRSSYWYLDCSAATQNLLLAAEALDLGAVWTGAYPYEERMQAVINTTGLPENILPLAVIPIGYPGGEEQPKDKYDQNKVHYNKW